MRRTVPPSAEIEDQIDQLLAVGVGENPREALSELAKLGARLIIQRAVEDEFEAWLGRARYERRPDYQRGLRNYESGLRNGYRPRRVQTAEGELEVRSRRSARLLSRSCLRCFRTRRSCFAPGPLEAMVVGAFVRGLSMRDVESLREEAGLGKLSKSTASTGSGSPRSTAKSSTGSATSRRKQRPRKRRWSPHKLPATGNASRSEFTAAQGRDRDAARAVAAPPSR